MVSSRQAPGPAGPLSLFRAGPDVTALPERVKAIIAAEDRASEILIGYVQVGIGLTLGALYLIAPRPTDQVVTMLSPTPIAIVAFLAFSLIRLWLILRGRVSDWFVGLSILADFGLLLGLIWSFQYQYGQPPGFSLKAPTFVYLFVFVVLRSLRFNPRYVLTAGLVAALGWLAMTMGAVMSSPPGAVTRNFVTYATSNHILIGAEFDKVFALLIATVLLTLGARQAQRTLVLAFKEQAAAREIGRFLSQGVAEQISRSATLIEAGQAAERDAAVLMIDIRGFTPLAMRVPARDVVRILTSFHALVVPIVRERGGVVDKFLGDGIMVTFGAVAPSDTAAADALRALERVLETAREWQARLAEEGIGETLNVNAAVAAGPVVFATLGGGDRLEYTVIGEAANLAAKLEKHNKIEKSRALTPKETFERARRQGYSSLGPIDERRGAKVAGVDGSIDLVAWLD